MPLASNFVWTFTTGASTNTTAPIVTSTNPADASVGAAGTNQKITATFSEAMNSTTINPVTFTLTGPGATPVAGTVTYSTIGTTATFAPSTALAADTPYTATVTTAAADLAGNALSSNFVWSFTTGDGTDTIAPTVSSINPLSGADWCRYRRFSQRDLR